MINHDEPWLGQVAVFATEDVTALVFLMVNVASLGGGETMENNGSTPHGFHSHGGTSSHHPF